MLIRQFLTKAIISHYLCSRFLTVLAVSRESPVCSNGLLQTVIIDFETDADGNPYQAGDTPTSLPGGVGWVKGKRKHRGSEGADDAAMLFDTSNPTGGDQDLYTAEEKLVLIISEDNDASDPDDNRYGGLLRFNFKEPAYQINSVEFLDIDLDNRGCKLVGKTTQGQELTGLLPRGGNGKLVTMDLDAWYDIEMLRVDFEGSGAVASVNLTQCTGV